MTFFTFVFRYLLGVNQSFFVGLGIFNVCHGVVYICELACIVNGFLCLLVH